MNDYTLVSYHANKKKKNYISAKNMQEIEKRQQISALMKAREKFEDYQNDVFSIIDKHGLNNDDDKTKLETAIKVLEYIIPKKKSSEVMITTKKIEDIIKETIPEADFTEIDDPDNTSDNADKQSK